MEIKKKILDKCENVLGFKCLCLKCKYGPLGNQNSKGCETCYQCWIATGDSITGQNNDSKFGVILCPAKIRYKKGDDDCEKFKSKMD